MSERKTWSPLARILSSLALFAIAFKLLVDAFPRSTTEQLENGQFAEPDIDALWIIIPLIGAAVATIKFGMKGALIAFAVALTFLFVVVFVSVLFRYR